MLLLFLYVVAIVTPPFALWFCRRWWQGLLSFVAIAVLLPTLPSPWGLVLVSLPLALYALFVVDPKMGAGRAVRRIKAQWGPDGQLL
jgi:hypothetical protein